MVSAAPEVCTRTAEPEERVTSTASSLYLEWRWRWRWMRHHARREGAVSSWMEARRREMVPSHRRPESRDPGCRVQASFDCRTGR